MDKLFMITIKKNPVLTSQTTRTHEKRWLNEKRAARMQRVQEALSQ
jgi:hypothetical protein